MSDDDKTRERQQQASAVEMQASGHGALTQEELDELVASSDTGARTPPGFVGKLILGVALCWSLFQLWIASPLPFMLNFAIISATDARAVHLAFALFLAFMAYPAEKSPFQLALGVSVPVILSGLFIYGARRQRGRAGHARHPGPGGSGAAVSGRPPGPPRCLWLLRGAG